MTRTRTFFVIAGEPSGDSLGANLMAGLKECAEGPVRFVGVGGPLMQAEGLKSLFPMSDLSIMGLIEILPKIPMLLRRLRQTAEAVIAAKPDALITIDSPDFCLRVAGRVKQALPDLTTIHYVAPSVWGWRPERAQKMARVIDHVLALLPFEPPYMERAGMTCDFVGHPAAAVEQATQDGKVALRNELGVGEARVITLLPGSRAGEIKRMAPVMDEVLRQLIQQEPDLKFVLPAAGAVIGQLRAAVAGWAVQPIILDPTDMPAEQAELRKRTAFAISDLALATSGTVSLELAAASCPMVIAYQANWMTTRMVKKLALIDTANLINIVTDTRIIPEFLFEKCRAGLIAPAVLDLLRNPQARRDQMQACAATMELLGRGDANAGTRAARSVLRAIA